MRVLLDTHIFFWWFIKSARISPKAFKTISEAEAVYVSSASIWEISIKALWARSMLTHSGSMIK